MVDYNNCLWVFSTNWHRARVPANTLTKFSYRVTIYCLVQLQLYTVLISCFLAPPHYSSNKSIFSISHLARFSSTSSFLSWTVSTERHSCVLLCVPSSCAKRILFTSFSLFTDIVIWKCVDQPYLVQFVLYKASCLLLMFCYPLDMYRFSYLFWPHYFNRIWSWV